MEICSVLSKSIASNTTAETTAAGQHVSPTQAIKMPIVRDAFSSAGPALTRQAPHMNASALTLLIATNESMRQNTLG